MTTPTQPFREATRKQMRRPSLRPTTARRPLPDRARIAAAVLAALAAPATAQLQFDALSGPGLPVDFDWTRALAFGDVDGDGDLDLAVGNGTLQDRLYRNDGTGTFTDVTAQQMPDGGGTSALELGDVDGDGDLDMVVTGQLQSRLYLNDGMGTFTNLTMPQQLPGSYDSLALGDVDGDGDLDIVLGGYNQQNRLLLNDGTGTFTDATAQQMPTAVYHTHSLKLGDVDGDGDLDLVIANSVYLAGEQNRLYLNDGSGAFTDATAQRMPAAINLTLSLALGDVDGDGDLDIVFGNTGQDLLYLNDGTGSFTDATAQQMPFSGGSANALALGDLDGDGDLDLVVGKGNWMYGGPNALFLNDGAGTFTDATAQRLPVASDYTLAVALADVDRDGDLDIAAGNSSVSPVQNHLYRNLQRQLHAPVDLQIGQTYTIEAYLRFGPASAVDLAAIYLSTGPASIPLPPFGTLGIDPAMAAPLPVLTIPQPAGVGSVSTVIPNVPGLIGQTIYSQAMMVAFPDDLRLSNVVVDVVQ